MKLILDDVLDLELKEYLLSQDGINDVKIDINDFASEINIKYDNRITPFIIVKHIELFQKKEYPIMLGFDKEQNANFKVLKYVVDDMCCEYCYKGLMQHLFKNKKIKSVKSNFDLYNSPFDIELTIEYDEKYSEDELLNYIKKNVV